ncbi:MAG: hypothetical protein IJ419_03120 [Agathobacter sp.]|nr:hypothetical protein [Agathobacter sp.]
MSVQSLYGVANSPAITNVNATEKKEETTVNTAVENKTGFDETAVIYEKSSTPDASITNKNNAIDREAIIAQMKADTEARMTQMQSYVQQMMNQQGIAIGTADDIWSFLASGDFTVTEAAKAKAQEAISEDGYWGVEQTSQRIVDFAKALAGNDVNKADELLEAFKKGFEEATGTWGKELPEISQNTYKAVEEKFAAWKAESETTPETEVTTTTDPTTGEVVTQ